MSGTTGCNYSDSCVSVPSAGLRCLQDTLGDKSPAQGGELPLISSRVASQTCGFPFYFGFPCPYLMTFRCLTGLLGRFCPPCPLLSWEGGSEEAAGEGCLHSIPSLLQGHSRQFSNIETFPGVLDIQNTLMT